MNKNLQEIAIKSGFPVNASGKFSIEKSFSFYGSYKNVELDSMIEKFANLLFEEFKQKWWIITPNNMENPFK